MDACEGEWSGRPVSFYTSTQLRKIDFIIIHFILT